MTELVAERTGRIGGLNEIASRYDAILCDVWGVIHNGVAPYTDAANALSSFRQQGGKVVMLTNSPKPKQPVVDQMQYIGIGQTGVYDDVVTSGDATRALIKAVEGPVYHLGPERDLILFEGLGVDLVDWRQADAVVCTGLWNDEVETPEDYADNLAQIVERGLPFICANPDIIVERGERLIWCSGALARDYRELGGHTLIAGKPHQPVYDRAMAKLERLNGAPVPKNRILAIGDGMPTDIKGAIDNGFNVLYVSAGIHAAEYGTPGDPDDDRLQTFLRSHNVSPVAYLPRLKW